MLAWSRLEHDSVAGLTDAEQGMLKILLNKVAASLSEDQIE
jgi:hypothetical protein